MVRLDTRPGYRRRVPQRLLSRHRKEVVAHALGVLVDPVHLQRGALGPRATVATNLGLAVARRYLPTLTDLTENPYLKKKLFLKMQLKNRPPWYGAELQ